MAEQPLSENSKRGSPPQKPPQKPPFRFSFWNALIVLTLLWFLMTFFLEGTHQTIPYSDFKQHLKSREVTSCSVGKEVITGKLEEVVEGETRQRRFETVRIEDPDLLEDLEAAEIDYSGQRERDLSWIFWVVMIVVMAGFWWFLLRSASGASGRLAGFGKSRAKIVPENSISVNFSDVAGCEEAKEDLKELVEFLQSPKKFTTLGARIPKGVLLVGPPGTGKTLIARAVAGEAGVPFFSISGSEFVEMFVGVGAARIRDLFEQAKAKAPCLVFMDEIDAIGRQRGVQFGAVNDEREQTLNQLLVELDGFEPNSGVILLAATNRPDVLDHALLRPGRFDRQVVLDSPDVRGREAILVVHALGKPMADDVDLGTIAKSTPGMSGADLANVLNEAALLAVRRRRQEIQQQDIEDAVEKVVAGPERKSRLLGPEDKKRVAFHEVGHALVALYSEHADPVHKISIVPRGRAALGYTLQMPDGEAFLRTRSALRDRVRGLLGGRAAEELFLGEISTGAQNDLEQATALVRQMICIYGMSERVGLIHCARRDPNIPLHLGPAGLTKDCSEEVANLIDDETRRFLAENYETAKQVLLDHEQELRAVVDELLRVESLDRETLKAIVERQRHPNRSKKDDSGTTPSQTSVTPD